MDVTGRCFCGAVRYRAPQPMYAPTLCHCRSCQLASGAHAVGWFTVLAEALIFEVGVPQERESSPGVRRGYCADCYSPLTYRHHDRPAEVDVTLASLNEPGGLTPVDHIHMQDAQPWDTPADGLPQFAAHRPTAKSGL